MSARAVKVSYAVVHEREGDGGRTHVGFRWIC